MSDLLIVESPAKAQTIEKYLGKNIRLYHQRDMSEICPKSTFGVDIENGFEPHYMTIRGKSDLIKSLKRTLRTQIPSILQPTLTERVKRFRGIFTTFWGLMTKTQSE